MAGLGVNLGIGDVIYLHNELLRTSTSGGDWGMIFILKQTQALTLSKQHRYIHIRQQFVNPVLMEIIE